MSKQAEYEAAYFTLLRAREDLDHLHRYQYILDEEITRLQGWITILREEVGTQVPGVIRRRLDDSVKVTIEGLQERIKVAEGELRALPNRIDDQQGFVNECEQEVEQLKP